jgi:hypothetical protein
VNGVTKPRIEPNVLVDPLRNDVNASRVGRALEEALREQLQRIPPGGRLLLSAKLEAGQVWTAQGEGRIEVQRARTGAVEVKLDGMAAAGPALKAGIASAEGTLQGGAAVTFAFQSVEEAADRLSALLQAPLQATSFAWAQRVTGDPDAVLRMADALRSTRRIEGTVGLRAEPELAVPGLELEVSLGADATFAVDLQRGVLLLERGVEGAQKLTAGIEAGSPHRKLALETTALASSSRLTWRDSYRIPTEQLRQVAAGAVPLSALLEDRAWPRTSELVQRSKSEVLGQELTAERVLWRTNPGGQVVDPPDGGSWSWKASAVEEVELYVDAKVAKGRLLGRRESPLETGRSAELEDIQSQLARSLQRRQADAARRAADRAFQR